MIPILSEVNDVQPAVMSMNPVTLIAEYKMNY